MIHLFHPPSSGNLSSTEGHTQRIVEISLVISKTHKHTHTHTFWEYIIIYAISSITFNANEYRLYKCLWQMLSKHLLASPQAVNFERRVGQWWTGSILLLDCSLLVNCWSSFWLARSEKMAIRGLPWLSSRPCKVLYVHTLQKYLDFCLEKEESEKRGEKS